MGENPRDSYIRKGVTHLVVKTRVDSYNIYGNPIKFEHPVYANLPEAVSRLQEIFLIGPDVNAADDGIYTWIIKRFANGVILMVAASPLCNQEIGTLHKNLDELTTDGKVIIAGEMEKKAGIITFNFESGTYSAPIFKTAPPHAIYQYIELFQSILPGSEYNPTPILSRAPIPMCPWAEGNLKRYFLRIKSGGARQTRRVRTRRCSRRRVRRRAPPLTGST
jgi:hypothetical protein